MTLIIIICIAIVIVAAVFGYFFLRDDDKKFASQFQQFRKETIEAKVTPRARLADTLFVQGLTDFRFEHKELAKVADQMHTKIIGMENLVNSVIINALCAGHILVEGVPGLAKTRTIDTFSKIMEMQFVRVQFTPDMLPSDLIGVEIFNSQKKEFEVKLGPIFANIVLADEINRTTPKVQSALLEAMQERQVTIAGETFALPSPFMVLATQNPLEQEGTYPLPEAQLDRFLMKVLVDYPTRAQEKEILSLIESDTTTKVKSLMDSKDLLALMKKRNEVVISDTLKDYITRIVEKTRAPHQYLLYGASPRGSIGLMEASKAVALANGRDHVTHEDIQRITLPVLRHRIGLTYDAQLDGYTADDVLLELVTQVTLG